MLSCNTLTSSFRFNVLTLFSCFFIILSSANAYSPPDSIEMAFKQQFPGAVKHRWVVSLDKGKEYKVDFFFKSTKYKAYFNQDGKLVEVEKEIHPSDLPNLVQQSLATQFQHYKVLKSYVIEKNDSVNAYEMTVKSDGVKTTLIMSRDGYMIAR